jgi:hypothetical protein
MPNFEKPNNAPKVERAAPTAEELEMLADFEAAHPELFPTAEQSAAEYGPLVEEFESLCAAFEAEHDLEALHAVVELDAAVAEQHPIREPAKKALIPIQQLLRKIEESTSIEGREFARLHNEYIKFSRAVGVINKGIVDHTRGSFE